MCISHHIGQSQNFASSGMLDGINGADSFCQSAIIIIVVITTQSPGTSEATFCRLINLRI